jgi:hypothetical protein
MCEQHWRLRCESDTRSAILAGLAHFDCRIVYAPAVYAFVHHHRPYLAKHVTVNIHRLSGDYNPLHIDPATAAHVGFDRPILHGLCTMGVSVRLVLREYGGSDPAAVASVKVLKGLLATRVWRQSCARPFTFVNLFVARAH